MEAQTTRTSRRGEQIIRAADVVVDKYLYHYTRVETLWLILASGCLRLGPFGATNDPRENKAWYASIGGFLEELEYRRDAEEIDRWLRGAVKLACFTRDKPWSPTMPYSYFHRGWARARMWQQYGDGHRGVCLMFDRAALSSAVEQHILGRGEVHHGEVLYADEPVPPLFFPADELARVGVEASAQSFRSSYWQELFLRKYSDWASEAEYRYLAFTEQQAELVPIRSALLAVILGDAFLPEDLALLPERLQAAGVAEDVRVAACKWWNGEPGAGSPKGWQRARDL